MRCVAVRAGVKGRLFELIEPTEKRWQVAVVCSAGRHLDTVITDSADTAKQCIKVCLVAP